LLESDAAVSVVVVLVVARPLSGPARPPLLLLLAVIPSDEEGEGDEGGVGLVAIDAHRSVAQ
jgi:hypothetical protein